MLIQHLPDDQTVATLLDNYNYNLAWRYFLYNASIVLVACLWGAALISAIACKRQGDSKAYLPRYSFVFLAIGSGLGILIAEIFFLCLFHLFTAENVKAVFFTTTALALFSLLHNREQWRSFCLPTTKAATLGATLFSIALCIYQIAATASWHFSDSTSYHVPYADYILQAHGLVIPQYLIYPYHSLNINIFYSLGLMIEHELTFIQTMHALFATLTLMGIYQFCLSTGQRAVIAISLCLFFSGIFVIHFSRFHANVDHGSMYFMLVSVFALYQWQENRRNWLLAVSAITFGMAIGSKYLMCTFAIPFAICIALTEGIPNCWRALLRFGLWTAAFGLWWYIRNWILTGNPVHPFATGIFGFYEWDQSDIDSQMSAVSVERIPKTLAGFLLMPYYAFRNAELVTMGAAWPLTILYGSTVFAFLADKRLRLLPIFTWIYLISWFLGSQDARHLEPVIPLLLVYAGHVAEQLCRKLLPTKFWTVAASLALPIPVVFSLLFLQQQLARVFFFELAPGPLRERSLRNDSPVYDLFSHANEVFSPEETIYEFFLRDGRWVFRGTVTGTQFGPNGYEHLVMAAFDPQTGNIDPARLQQVLQARYHADGFIIPLAPYTPYNTENFDRFFDLKYRNSIGAVYRFRTTP